MTTRSNSLEGITPSGTTLTVTPSNNTGGTSGDPFDAVTIGTLAGLVSDTAHAAHGSQSCHASATSGTSAAAHADYAGSLGSSVSQAWFRQYLYFTANPGGLYRIWQANTSAGALCANIVISATGTLTFRDATNTGITGTTSAAVPLDAWFRIEGFVIGAAAGGAGQVQLKIFTTPDSTTAAQTLTSAAGLNTNGPMGQWLFGVCAPVATAPSHWFDDPAASDTGYIGPATVPAISPPAGQAAGDAAAAGPGAMPGTAAGPLWAAASAAIAGSWTSASSADGPPDGASATWASSSAADSAALELSGFAAQPAVPSAAVLGDVQVTIWHSEAPAADVSSVTAQLFKGAVAVGDPQPLTVSAVLHPDTITIPGLTWADLADVRVRVTAARP